MAEEHSTATLATERLEAEQSDRMRLEKEKADLEVSFLKSHIPESVKSLSNMFSIEKFLSFHIAFAGIGDSIYCVLTFINTPLWSVSGEVSVHIVAVSGNGDLKRQEFFY